MEPQALLTRFARGAKTRAITSRSLLRSLDASGVQRQALTPIGLALLGGDPLFKRWRSRGRPRLLDPEWRAAFGDRLFLALLTKTVICGLDWEEFLTALRRSCLERLASGRRDDDLRACLPGIAALACQCFNNDFAYAVSAREERQVLRLGRRIEARLSRGSRARLDLMLAVYGLYRPLWRLRGSRRLTRGGRFPQLRELFARQIGEPIRERELRRRVVSWGGLSDEVSRSVRRQYEESPYPRWLDLPLERPAPLSEKLVKAFPGLALPAKEGKPARTEVLVAGCATGRLALSAALNYSRTRVLGVDLSRSSLAYAMRKARELGARNVRFRQADILRLGALRRRFDYIDSVGVLHHLKDPAAGLEALAARLRPGGVMRLGLYSRRARSRLEPARRIALGAGSLRQARRRVLAWWKRARPEWRDAPMDLFIMSHFRDMFRHARETSFSLTQIHGMLRGCGLRFMGLEGLPPRARRDFERLHPDRLADLEAWDAFEEAGSGLCESLYVLWAQKAHRGGSRAARSVADGGDAGPHHALR